MIRNAEFAAALGVAFGVVLAKAFPKDWPLWQEAVAVAAICMGVYGILKILGSRNGD